MTQYSVCICVLDTAVMITKPMTYRQSARAPEKISEYRTKGTGQDTKMKHKRYRGQEKEGKRDRLVAAAESQAACEVPLRVTLVRLVAVRVALLRVPVAGGRRPDTAAHTTVKPMCWVNLQFLFGTAEEILLFR